VQKERIYNHPRRRNLVAEYLQVVDDWRSAWLGWGVTPMNANETETTQINAV
jgi:hypothetical protein